MTAWFMGLMMRKFDEPAAKDPVCPFSRGYLFPIEKPASIMATDAAESSLHDATAAHDNDDDRYVNICHWQRINKKHKRLLSHRTSYNVYFLPPHLCYGYSWSHSKGRSLTSFKGAAHRAGFRRNSFQPRVGTEMNGKNSATGSLTCSLCPTGA